MCRDFLDCCHIKSSGTHAQISANPPQKRAKVVRHEKAMTCHFEAILPTWLLSGWKRGNRIMRRSVLASFAMRIAAVLAVAASISTAQQPQPVKSLQFEVAAIKPGNPQEVGSSSSTLGGQFRMVNTPLKQWVELGLLVPDYALKAPSWLDTSRFDLNAKLPYEPVDRKAEAEMMKALLIERFGLKWHEDFQSVSGYELVPDKKVLVEPSGLLDRLKGHGSASGPSLISGTNMPMSELAEVLGKVLGRPVVDTTHLSGVFSFKLMWRPSDDAEVASQQRYGKQYGVDVNILPSSVSTALREQLGLRLQNAKVPLKVIVVDKLNHEPTEN